MKMSKIWYQKCSAAEIFGGIVSASATSPPRREAGAATSAHMRAASRRTEAGMKTKRHQNHVKWRRRNVGKTHQWRIGASCAWTAWRIRRHQRIEKWRGARRQADRQNGKKSAASASKNMAASKTHRAMRRTWRNISTNSARGIGEWRMCAMASAWQAKYQYLKNAETE